MCCRFPESHQMPVGKSSFANSPAGGGSTRSKEIPRRSSSKNSINFDSCNSPDYNSVALEKELADLDIEDQVRAPPPPPPGAPPFC